MPPELVFTLSSLCATVVMWSYIYMTQQILSHLAWRCVPRRVNPCWDWWDVLTPCGTLLDAEVVFFSHACTV